ncbi:MAG: VacJ family lipoprotein [Candidatus Binataceae bacterium]
MKRLLSIPMILCVLALSACATPQANTEGQFGTIASDAGQPAPGIGTAVSGTSAMVESDTPGTPALDAEAAKSNDRVLVSSDLGPPLQGGPEANQQEPSDPFEPINTRVLTFNEKADEWFVRPVVSGYSAVVPPPARDGIGRVFNNAAVIPRVANSLFQFRLKQAYIEAARFGINSTLGLGGWFDLAHEWFGLEGEENDFGLTLAKYGVGEGPYLMLPGLGPSSVRDVIGMAADGLMDPIDYVAPGSAVYYKYAAKALQAVNARTQNRGLFEYLDTYSIDKYGAIQDAYFQRRQKQEASVKASGLQIHLRTAAEGSDF